MTYKAQVYTVIMARLTPDVQDRLDALLVAAPVAEGEEEEDLPLSLLRRDPGPVGVESALSEITKLRSLRAIGLPHDLFQGYTPKLVERLRRRIAAESPSHIRQHPPAIRRTLLAALVFQRTQEVTDALVTLLIQIVHRIGKRAERRVESAYINDLKQVSGKTRLLYRIADAVLEHPDEPVRAVVYPIANEQTLRDLVEVLGKAINWDVIRQQYDMMVKYATALKTGTADADALLRRFTRSNLQHPTYQGLSELGRVIKTIFLCDYLSSQRLRQDIQEALNVIEQWNSVNGFIFSARGGELLSNRPEDQEIAILSLHLIQVSLALVNTLMVQDILAEERWKNAMKREDWRGLTPLFYQHVNPYGRFTLDLTQRIPLSRTTIA